MLAQTFLRRTSTNSPRFCSIKRTLDFSPEYMMSLISSCCTDPACSELWIERISGNPQDVRGRCYRWYASVGFQQSIWIHA